MKTWKLGITGLLAVLLGVGALSIGTVQPARADGPREQPQAQETCRRCACCGATTTVDTQIPAGAKTCTATPMGRRGQANACAIPCGDGGSANVTIGVSVQMTGRGFVTGSVSCTDMKQWYSCTASASFIPNDTCTTSGPALSHISRTPVTPGTLRCEETVGEMGGIIGPPTGWTVTCWVK